MTQSNENTLTALDYIKKQELEREAREALPGKFEKCTFPLGYIRQPVYACKTCNSLSGMCYSCSMSCHADHELLELFAKRHFRCDCGLLDKFDNHPSNDENKYNHNFRGLYCRCGQTYDPEKEEGTMFQCITCEDWFHEQCIGNIPEEVEDFDCYICRECTKKYSFVMNGRDKRFSFGLSKGDEAIKTWVLPDKVVEDKALKNKATEEIVIEDKATEKTAIEDKAAEEIVIEDKTNEETIKAKTNEETEIEDKTKDKPIEEAVTKDKDEILKVKEYEAENTSSKATPMSDTKEGDHRSLGEKRKREEDEREQPVEFKKLKGDGCSSVDLSSLPEYEHIEVFLQETWRDGLCKCQKCLEAYKSNSIEFLFNEEKTHEPEEDEDAGRSLLEIGMEQLERIERVQVIESLMAYKDLANDLKSYFSTFKDSGKIVTKEDINDFFATKKRERE
ncbi:unnamed protein product [Rhizopus stolonifer]